MPKSGDVSTCTTYSPVGSAHVWGSRSSSAPGDARDRFAHDEREQHEERDRRNDPRTSSRLRPGAFSAAGSLGDDHRPGHDAPRRHDEAGHDEEEEPDPDADLVDEGAEEQ